MSRELPILFNGEMVRAILDGRKVETRRPVKPQPEGRVGCDEGYTHCDDSGYLHGRSRYVIQHTPSDIEEGEEWMTFPGRAPWRPGDLLYVREAFLETGDDFEDIVYRASSPGGNHLSPCDFSFGSGGYPDSCRYMPECVGCYPTRHPWRPSIHMPKRASRIWLRVLDVRVERVQEITGEQSQAEGVEIPTLGGHPCARLSGKHRPVDYDPRVFTEWDDETWWRTHFASLWDSIYAAQDLGWDCNPFVWVCRFEVVSTTGKPA